MVMVLFLLTSLFFIIDKTKSILSLFVRDQMKGVISSLVLHTQGEKEYSVLESLGQNIIFFCGKRGIYQLSQVFQMRILFSLELKEINHSHTKYEGKVYKFFPSVWRIGIRFVFDYLIYPNGTKIS